MVRTAPPGVDSASKTSTSIPACAKTIAAANPFGPAPTTHALCFLFLAKTRFAYSFGDTVGHCTTWICPS